MTRVDFNQVMQAVRGGKIHTARALCRALLGDQTGHREASQYLALTSHYLGDSAEALATLGGMPAAQRNQPGMRLLRAGALLAVGRAGEAVALYQRLVQADAQPFARYALGIALQLLGRLDEADNQFREALRVNAGFLPAYGGLAIRPEASLQQRLAGMIPVPVDKPATGGLRVKLVYPPFTLPNLPLGIASLKAYVESASPHRVTCVDLSNIFNNLIVAAYAEGRVFRPLAGDFVRFPIANDAEALLEAVAAFQSGDAERFYRRSAYDGLARRFLERLSYAHDVFKKQCGFSLQNSAPAPWYLEVCARELLRHDTAVVGMSIMFPEQLPFAYLLTRVIKAKAPGVRVVFGGALLDEAFLKEFWETSLTDQVVFNDGEEPLLALLNAMAAGVAVAIPEVHHRQPPAGPQPAPDKPGSLSKLPMPDFADYDLRSYFTPQPVLPLLGSRGCYWRKCTFCTHFKSFTHTYRALSAGRVVDEIVHYRDTLGIRYFNFVDEMISPQRFRQISEELLERGVEIRFYALAKPNGDFTPELMATMYRAGCRYLLWGVESASQRMLDAMGKGTRADELPGVMRAAAQAGIRNHLFIMVGFPGEKAEDLRATLAFLHDHREVIHCIHGGGFLLQPDSPIYADPARFDLQITGEERAPYNLASVSYRSGRGPGSAQSAKRGEVCNRLLFEKMAWYSNHLGGLRNQALLIYDQAERLILDGEFPGVPPPDEVLAACRAAEA